MLDVVPGVRRTEKLYRFGLIVIGLALMLTGCRSGELADSTAENVEDPTETISPTSSVRVGKWSSAETNGIFWVFGELVNTGWNAVHDIETEATLLDEDGEEIIRGAPIHVTTLPAGDKGFFYVSFEDVNPDLVDDVSFGIGAVPGLSSRFYTDYAMLDLTASETDDGSIAVSGIIQNLGAVRAESVQIFVVGYDDDGQVVLVQHGVTPTEGIGPGQSWAFEELDAGGIGVKLPRSLDSITVGSLP